VEEEAGRSHEVAVYLDIERLRELGSPFAVLSEWR